MTNTIKHKFYLRAIQISEFSTSTQKKFFVIARASDLFLPSAVDPAFKHIQRTVFPLGANLREPSDKNRAVKSILQSIDDSLFHEIDNPIQLCAVTAKEFVGRGAQGDRGLALEFDGDDGVLDGAHRLFALWKAKNNGVVLDNVRVSFIVTTGVSNIATKCVNLNTYAAPTKLSLMDKSGVFDHIKPLYAVPFPFLRYKDNETGSSDSPFASITGIDSLIKRSTGKTQAVFGHKGRGSSGTSMGQGGGTHRLAAGVSTDEDYWKLLYSIHPAFEYLMKLFEIETENKTCRFVSSSKKPMLLASGQKYNFNFASRNIAYLFMSCLAVNFDHGTQSWVYPLAKVSKAIFPRLITEFKYAINQRSFAASAGAVCSNPVMVKRLYDFADNIYNEKFGGGKKVA